MSSGVYCLVMVLEKNSKIKAGKRVFEFFPGFYCYVGSAMGGLEQRLRRHLSEKKKNFWHIDYFLKKARVVELKTIETDKRIECKISKRVEKLSDKTIEGFGSSDCKCPGHLYYFGENPAYRKEFHNIFLKNFRLL